MNILPAKPLFHLSTFVMEVSDEERHDRFDEDIRRYMEEILQSRNRSEAIYFRSNALQFLDQWRLQRLEQLDQRVRTAGQLILNAFDQSQSTFDHRTRIIFELSSSLLDQRQRHKYSHRSRQSTDVSHDQSHVEKTTREIEISINRSKSSPSNSKTISLDSIDFARDFTCEILVNLSSPSSSEDIAMVVCENQTLIYSQNSHELIIVSLCDPKQMNMQQFDKNTIIRDLCYVDWLHRCLVIANEEIYLFDYRTGDFEMIDSGLGYICGTIDNQHRIFYLIKQTTLYKYDENSLLTLQADQYPIADGYQSRRMALDNQTNDHLALLVIASDGKNYVLVYATKVLDNGYLYKIMIDDRIERDWICSNGNHGWLIRGNCPRTCLDLSETGLASIRVFNCTELRNIISLDGYERRFLIRTKTEIFLFLSHSTVSSF